MINPIAKAVHPPRTGILARTHAHPRGNRDWRNHALQPSVNSGSHQAPEIYQALVAKHYFGRRAIEAEHADFHSRLRISLQVRRRLNNSGSRAAGELWFALGRGRKLTKESSRYRL